jgi:hypothetical protein
MCFKNSQMQIPNRYKYGFWARSMFREKRRIGAVRVSDLFAFERQVIALGDK